MKKKKNVSPLRIRSLNLLVEASTLLGVEVIIIWNKRDGKNTYLTTKSITVPNY